MLNRITDDTNMMKKVKRSVTITIPHGTVIVMSSLMAGNHGNKYMHSIGGAWGTYYMGINLARKRD